MAVADMASDRRTKATRKGRSKKPRSIYKVSQGLTMARFGQPTYREVHEADLPGILVSGIDGIQPESQAKWYLMCGYNVYHPDTREPIIARLLGKDEEAHYVLYTVTYPKGYKPRTREPGYDAEPHDIGRWKDVYRKQIRTVCGAMERLKKNGQKVTPRKWKQHTSPVHTNRYQPLQIELADPEELEPAQLACRDYLANLPDARLALNTSRGRRSSGMQTINQQRQDDVLLGLIDSSEGRSRLITDREMSASSPPEY